MWPFTRHRHDALPASESQREAAAAKQRTLEDINRIDERWSEVRGMTEDLRKLRNENHFAEHIQHIFGGKA